MLRKNIIITVVVVLAVLLGVEAAVLYVLWNDPQEVKITEDTLEEVLDDINLSSDCSSYFATDSDGDGVGDNLEKKYKTDLYNSDTDSDSKEDKDEIEQGENPLGDGVITLDGEREESWKEYSNESYNYKLYLPEEWDIEEVEDNHANIYEDSRDDSPVVRAHVYTNKDQLEYKDYFVSWYIDATQITPIQIGGKPAQKINDETGVKIATNLDDTHVLVLTYFENTEDARAIINSLEIIE